MADVADALARIADDLTIGVDHPDPHGPLRLSLDPAPETLKLAPFLDGPLTEVVTAPIDAQFVLKQVRFDGAQVADEEGMLVDPLPDGDLTESPVDAVEGMLVALEGTLPIGFVRRDLGSLDVSVRWEVERSCSGPSPADTDGRRVPGSGVVTDPSLPTAPPSESEASVGVGFGDSEPVFLGPDSGTSVEMLLLPPVAPFRAGEDPPICWYRIRAHVRLIALGVEHEVDLPPVTVPVPALTVPSVALFYSEPHFNTAKRGGAIVVLPPGFPTGIDAVMQRLGNIIATVDRFTTVARFAAMLAGLSSIVSALSSLNAVTEREPIVLTVREHPRLQQLRNWRDGRIPWTGADPGDDIDSLMLFSVDTTHRLHLYGDGDYNQSNPKHRGHGVLHPNSGGYLEIADLDHPDLVAAGQGDEVGAPAVAPPRTAAIEGATMEIREPPKDGSWHDIITGFRWQAME